jgi:MFS family permease
MIGAALAAAGLVGQRRLAGAFGVAIVFWGLPIAFLAIWTQQIGALILLGIVGIANTVVDVAGMTILQRSVPDQVLARVFGVLESLVYGTLLLGSVIAAAIIEGVGAKTAMIVTGALLPVLVGLSWAQLRRIDGEARYPIRELDLLRGIPFLAILPGPSLDELALKASPVAIPEGTAVIREGEAGDRFYVIADGSAEVSVDGEVRTSLGPGDSFGEIALLRDVPRTATVAAASDLSLLALERDDFIAAVTGHAPSTEAAGAVVSSRLGQRPTGLGTA